MTKERAKELLPIIQAFANGADIEAMPHTNNKWIPAIDPVWYDNYDYRIKPKPQEGWIVFYGNNPCFADYFDTKQKAKQRAELIKATGCENIRIVKVKEVTE